MASDMIKGGMDFNNGMTSSGLFDLFSNVLSVVFTNPFDEVSMEFLQHLSHGFLGVRSNVLSNL